MKKLSGKELRDKGEQLGIKVYGTKKEMISKIKSFLEASEIATMNAAEKLKNELIVNIDDVDEDDEALIADYIIHPEPQLDSQSDSFTNNGNDGDNKKRGNVQLRLTFRQATLMTLNLLLNFYLKKTLFF